jgi:hypothetical protein
MSEQCSTSPCGEPIKRVKGLPENKQCLKFPGFECNCRLSDIETRRKTLRKLRQDLGIYSAMDLMDTKLVDLHETKREQLCEGQSPTFIERLKSIRIRIF